MFYLMKQNCLLSKCSQGGAVVEEEVRVNVSAKYSLVQVNQTVKTGQFRINAVCSRMSVPFPCGRAKCVTAAHPHVTIATGSLTLSVESLTWMWISKGSTASIG